MARLLIKSFVLVLLISVGTRVVTPGLAAADEPFISQFEKAARSEFQLRTKTLRRPLKFYHYGTRGNLNQSPFSRDRGPLIYGRHEAINYLTGLENAMKPAPLKPPAAIHYFKSLAESHAAADGEHEWTVGAGIYFATDPVQSESYIGLPWFLLEMELPADIRYLDIQGDNKLEFPESILDVYRKHDYRDGPPMHGNEGVLGNGVIFGRLMRDDDTRAILVRLFREFKIDFIAYSWNLPSYGICLDFDGKRFEGGVAINVINPSLIDRAQNWSFFVAQLETSASPEKKNAYRLVLEKIELGYVKSIPLLKLNEEIEYSFSDASAWTSRVATYGWNRALGRKSTLETFISPNTLKRLARYVNAEPRDDGEGSLRYKSDSSSLAVVRDIPWNQRAFMPELVARSFRPTEAAEIEARIQTETWGCAADGRREEGNRIR